MYISIVHHHIFDPLFPLLTSGNHKTVALYLLIAQWPKEVTWLRQDLRYGGYSVYSERALYSYMAKGTHTGNSEELGALMPSTTNIWIAFSFNMGPIVHEAGEKNQWFWNLNTLGFISCL